MHRHIQWVQMSEMKRIIYLVILAFGIAGCAGTASVTKTTSQVWHGGAAGSGGGKNYKVYATKSPKLAVTVDQVWVGDREKGWLPDFRVVYKDLANGLRNHDAPAGVTAFTVEFGEVYPGQPNNPRGETRPVAIRPFDPPPTDLPPSFDKGAVIYLHLANKATTWVVAEMEILEPLNYP